MVYSIPVIIFTSECTSNAILKFVIFWQTFDMFAFYFNVYIYLVKCSSQLLLLNAQLNWSHIIEKGIILKKIWNSMSVIFYTSFEDSAI